jgi:phage-related protein
MLECSKPGRLTIRPESSDVSKAKPAPIPKPLPARPQLFSPWHPDRLGERNPPIIRDLLELVSGRKTICVRKMIEMLRDLQDHGLASRYSKHLFNAIYELKDRTADGGARVYFLHGDRQRFFIVHAECKKESQASEAMLVHCIEILEALENATPLFPPGKRPKGLSVLERMQL